MPRRSKLSRENIVEAAMKMLDAHGEKGFSMRKLAGEMGVDPMALYHHHANRSALMHDVMQALMDTCDLPPPGDDWRQNLRDLCTALRRLAHRHPGAFRIYETYDEWLPAEHRLHEAFHATLLRAGFAPRSAVRAARLLLAYTESFAVDEISGWLAPFDSAERQELAASLAAGPYPVMSGLIDDLVSIDPDADFEFGLDVILRGLVAELA